jgi:hypothetical protein
MLHGIVYAQKAPHLETDPGHDFSSEVHSYFGSGTQLQELYITPSLLSSADWDVLAEAAKWSRRNAGVLIDTHWVGGDPRWLEVYGWAAWTPERGVLTLRNPRHSSFPNRRRGAIARRARGLPIARNQHSRFRLDSRTHSTWRPSRF